MTLVVADASALAEYLLRTARGTELDATLTMPQNDVHVPALCDIEIVAALRRALVVKKLTPSRARLALAAYDDLPLTRHGHQALLPRILALRDNFSPYDATYVALAEALNAPLLTADAALRRAAARHVHLM